MFNNQTSDANKNDIYHSKFIIIYLHSALDQYNIILSFR